MPCDAPDLLERHEILRTSYRVLSGMSVPLQSIAETSPALRLVYEDLGCRRVKVCALFE